MTVFFPTLKKKNLHGVLVSACSLFFLVPLPLNSDIKAGSNNDLHSAREVRPMEEPANRSNEKEHRDQNVD